MAWPPLPGHEFEIPADHINQPQIHDVAWSLHMIDQIQLQNLDPQLGSPPGRCVYTDSIALYHYSSFINGIIPDPDVMVDGTTVLWSFDDRLLGMGSQSGSSSGARPRVDFYKNRHDLVAEALGMTSTDVTLREAFGEYDDDDILTPDYIHQSEDGVFHILEFATSRDSNHSHLRQVLENKLLKYRFALEARAKAFSVPICFSVVVVSPLCIASNILLPQRIIDALGFRLRVACTIDDKASALGIIFHEDQTVETTIEREIKAQLENMSLLPSTSDNPYLITTNYFDFAKTPLKTEEINIIKHQAKVMVEKANQDLKEAPISPGKAQAIYLSKQAEKNTKRERKPITSLPIFVCDQEEDQYNAEVEDIYIPYHGCPLILDIWRQAFISFSCLDRRPHTVDDENDEDGIYKIYKSDEEVALSDTKHEYCRVKLSLSHDHQVYLASKGVSAKRYQNNPYVKMHVENSRKAFNKDSPLDDIDDFITDDTWVRETRDQDRTTFSNIESLLITADNLQGNKGAMMEEIKVLHSTKISIALQICSKIAQELAISFRQHTTRDQFILKKLRGYPIYLLIKTVNTRSHIFFSILVPPGYNVESYGLPFPPMIEFNGFHYTGFRSFTAPKLSNQFVLNEMWIGSLIRWVIELDTSHTGQVKQAPDLKPSSVNNQAVRMSLLALLVAMEDKASTEAEMTLSRFMYMEMFKAENEHAKPNPLKMVLKFNYFPRSRLLLWVQHQLLGNFSKMVENPPKAESVFRLSQAYTNSEGKRIVVPEYIGELPKEVRPTDVSMDRWTGLINCFTGDPLPNMSSVVNVMYTGYYKDKNEAPWENSDWKLVEKILEEEFKLDPSRVAFYGDKEPPADDIRDHEFSPCHVKYGCSIAANQLTQKFGLTYALELESLMVKRLSRTSIVDLATLKASAVIDSPDRLVLDSPEDVDKSSKRVKAMEAAAELADDLSSHPYTQLESVLDTVEETWGGIACDLFKKQQHAGLREIYVLEFQCRVIQRFVETAGRVLCEQFEIDTLSHPTIKHKTIDDHISSSLHMSEDSSKVLINCKSSGDKTRWNQNIMVKAYAIIFSQLYPERTAKALCRCLNLWYGKLVKLPRGLQRLLINNTPLENPIYDRLLSQYWGNGTSQDIQVMEEKTKYFRTMSGMFQGILHYTSSMLHVIERLSYKQLCHLVFATKYPEYPLKVTVMCCSDDSCTMMTTAVPVSATEKEKASVKRLLTQLVYSQSHHSLYCNMRESVKSTFGTCSVMEYNSVFLCKGTVIVPTFKFWEAGLKISQTESIKARIENMYNLLRALSENSASAVECRSMQILQACVFYKTLGVDVNEYWPLLKDRLCSTHNVDLGFFPVDDELCPGLLGLKYNMYIASLKGEYGKTLVKLFQAGAFDCSPKGELVSSVILNFGNRRRLKQLQETVECSEDWEAIVNEHPEILYRKAHSTIEAKLQITIASHQPGVHESLNMGNSFFNSITSSVYCANKPCITVRLASEDNGKIVTSKVKTSLISALKLVSDYKTHEPSVAVADLFPNANVYNQISLLLNRLKSEPLRLRTVPNLKRKLTTVLWQLDTELLEAPMSKSARLVWFGYKSNISSRTLKGSWERQKERIPWLRNSASETLEESPFENHMGLRNFIDSHGNVSRTIRVVAPPIRSHTFLTQLEDIIRTNYMPGRLVVSARPEKEEPCVYLSGISGQVTLALLSPRDDHRKLGHIVDIMKQTRPVTRAIPTLRKMLKMEAYLTIMHWIGRSVHDPTSGFSEVEVRAVREAQDAVDAIRSLKDTVIDFVVLRQSMDAENNPRGRGTTRLYIRDCNVQLEFRDDVVERILVPDLESLYSAIATVIDYVKWSGHSFETREAWGFSDDTVATLTSAGLSSKRHKGTPITLDSDLKNWELDARDLGVYLEVQEDTLKLISRQKYCTLRMGKKMNYFVKDQVLCYYKASCVYTDIPREGILYEEEDFDSAWSNGRRFNCVALASLIHYLRESEDESVTDLPDCPLENVEDKDHLSAWLKATFRARVGHLYGIYPTPTKQDIEAIPSDTSADLEPLFGDGDFFLDDDWGEQMTNIISALEPSTQGTQDETPEEETMETMFSEFGDEGLQTYFETLTAQQTMGSSRETIYSHHPFWDDFIEESESMSQGIIKRVAQGRVGVQDHLSSQLSWLMEKYPSRARTSKLESFYATLGTSVIKRTQTRSTLPDRAQSDIVPSEPSGPQERVWRPNFRKRGGKTKRHSWRK